MEDKLTLVQNAFAETKVLIVVNNAEIAKI